MQLKPTKDLWIRCCVGYIFTYNYIDNLLIASPDAEEHKKHLRLVLEWLQRHGVLINPAKCELGVGQLQFLGHQIDNQGIRPLNDKMQVVMEFPKPVTSRKLREFLRLVHFCHRFIPNAACILQPLHQLLEVTKDGKTKLCWINEATLAFKASKQALASTTFIILPQAGCSDIHYV